MDAPRSPGDDSATGDGSTPVRPEWFEAFLADRGTRKPSPHTMKAYRQDFATIAELLGGAPGGGELSLTDITRDSMRHAFAEYAQEHEPASIRRAWSTWNVLCTFLYTAELIPSNPMPLVGRPKVGKTLPEALPSDAVAALLAAIDDDDSQRHTDWAERDRALILTALLAGLRADELLRTNVGDIRATDDGGGVIHVRGKGGKDRRVPVEPGLIAVIEAYLQSRRTRFPGTTKRSSIGAGLTVWPAQSPLFVGRGGERITRGALQYRVLRAFRRAGPDAQRVRGALVHGLRHTFATELANAEVSVYTLMKLLGHESMTTSQRYVAGAGTETRTAAARNPLYGLIGASGVKDGQQGTQ